MTDQKKAARYLAIAHALERQAPEHPAHVEMGMRDIAARFRFNALAHLDDEAFLDAGHLAATEVLKIATREELKDALEKRFCLRCLGITIIGVLDVEGSA